MKLADLFTAIQPQIDKWLGIDQNPDHEKNIRELERLHEGIIAQFEELRASERYMESFTDETGQILLKETEHYQLMSFDNDRGFRLRNLDTDNSIVVQGYDAANFRAEFDPYEWPTGAAIDLFFDELWDAYSTGQSTD